MPRSPLFVQLETAQAQFTSYHEWEMPVSFGAVETEYRALRETCGLLDYSHRGQLHVYGPDAPRFLHGMVSNEVKALGVGKGNYAFFLDVHGHILADAYVLRLSPESYLVDCEPQSTEVIRQDLDRHVIADQVEVEDQSSQTACLALEGPRAREVVRRVFNVDLPPLEPQEHILLEPHSVRLLRASVSGKEGYWLLVSPDQAGGLWEKILEAGSAAGLRPVGWEALEVCRIEAGIPRYGVDINDKTLPQETGQMHAISFTKGCYIGQEVVERIRSRGHVNRQLAGLLFEAKRNIARAAMVLAAGHPAGMITSAAYSFGLGRTIALAYLRRESAQPGTAVMVGYDPAEVVALPFVTSNSER